VLVLRTQKWSLERNGIAKERRVDVMLVTGGHIQTVWVF
jgi:hypothetical protein